MENVHIAEDNPWALGRSLGRKMIFVNGMTSTFVFQVLSKDSSWISILSIAAMKPPYSDIP